MSYYKHINGKRYDSHLLDLASSLVRKRRDGRISLDDLQSIFNAVNDRNIVTNTEINTLKYIRQAYNFTRPAITFYNTHIGTLSESD